MALLALNMKLEHIIILKTERLQVQRKRDGKIFLQYLQLIQANVGVILGSICCSVLSFLIIGLVVLAIYGIRKYAELSNRLNQSGEKLKEKNEELEEIKTIFTDHKLQSSILIEELKDKLLTEEIISRNQKQEIDRLQEEKNDMVILISELQLIHSEERNAMAYRISKLESELSVAMEPHHIVIMAEKYYGVLKGKVPKCVLDVSIKAINFVMVIINLVMSTILSCRLAQTIKVSNGAKETSRDDALLSENTVANDNTDGDDALANIQVPCGPCDHEQEEVENEGNIAANDNAAADDALESIQIQEDEVDEGRTGDGEDGPSIDPEICEPNEEEVGAEADTAIQDIDNDGELVTSKPSQMYPLFSRPSPFGPPDMPYEEISDCLYCFDAGAHELDNLFWAPPSGPRQAKRSEQQPLIVEMVRDVFQFAAEFIPWGDTCEEDIETEGNTVKNDNANSDDALANIQVPCEPCDHEQEEVENEGNTVTNDNTDSDDALANIQVPCGPCDHEQEEVENEIVVQKGTMKVTRSFIRKHKLRLIKL